MDFVFAKLFLIALPVFFAIDMVWLVVVANKFYGKELAHLMSPNVTWWAAIVFYLIFIIALLVFVVVPAREAKSISKAIIYGAFFGLASYATYDLTNLATLKDWPLIVTVVDLIWGSFVSAAVAGLTYLIAEKIGI
jgi:uncharacterized membrane protein